MKMEFPREAEARVAGVPYREFFEAVDRAIEKMKGKKFVFAQEETKYLQAITICAALLTGIPVIPLCKEYGKERNKKVIAAVEHKKIPKKVAVILFTSGTSGEPKGVMLTVKALLKNIRAIQKYMGMEQRSVMIVRPLVHSAVFTGELLLALYSGWDINFWDKPIFPAELCRYMKLRKATVAGMTPTLLKSFLRLKCIPTLKEIILSGERLFKKDAKLFAQNMPDCKFYSVYGLTENGPRVSALTPDEFITHVGSVGKPLADTRVRIVDGELWVKSPSIMKGYLGNRNDSRKVKKRGWLKTGDRAREDAAGYLYIRGRKDEMMIRGGMNLYPAEVEEPFQQMRGINECIVYGKTDAHYGQRIIMEYTGTATEDEVSAYAVKYLPAYLVPNEIHRKIQLSKTASGKLERRKNI